MNFLALSTPSIDVEAHNFGAVERLLRIAQTYLHVVRRQFLEQELQGVHPFLVAGTNRDLTSEDNAFILGSELTGQQIYIAHHTKRHNIVALKDMKLLTLGCTMEIDAIAKPFTIPHEIYWHAVGLTIHINHRQNAVFGSGKDFARPCFVEQTVLPPDFAIIVLQN